MTLSLRNQSQIGAAKGSSMCLVTYVAYVSKTSVSLQREGTGDSGWHQVR